MFALIVKTHGLSFERRPCVAEVSRDRPRTLFTRARCGENRHHKDGVRYRLFDTREEAEAALPQEVRDLLELEKSHEEALRATQDHIRRAVDGLVAGDDWSGGR